MKKFWIVHHNNCGWQKQGSSTNYVTPYEVSTEKMPVAHLVRDKELVRFIRRELYGYPFSFKKLAKKLEDDSSFHYVFTIP